jgi:hypothetical protein
LYNPSLKNHYKFVNYIWVVHVFILCKEVMGRDNKHDKGQKLKEPLANWLTIDIKKQNAFFFATI